MIRHNLFPLIPARLATVQGNLLDLFEEGMFDAIVHGCNCFCSMGGGIAAQIAQRYPEVSDRDNETIPGDMGKLGNIDLVDTAHGLVINGYTQYNPGADFNYCAIDNVLRKVAHIAGALKLVVGDPAIGTGIAGGDWGHISRIIEIRMKEVDHVYVEFKP